jgi:methyl-accepting chemotaxis protein
MMASASIWNTGVKSIVQFRSLTALCILSLATLAGSVQARERDANGVLVDSNGGIAGDLIKSVNEVNNGTKSIGEVAVFVSRRQLNQQLTASTITNLITLLALVAVMAIVMTIVMNQIIIGPITRLAKHAEDISHGNLKQKIRPESHDEIGQLAEAFHCMQTSLSVAFKRIYAKANST